MLELCHPTGDPAEDYYRHSRRRKELLTGQEAFTFSFDGQFLARLQSTFHTSGWEPSGWIVVQVVDSSSSTEAKKRCRANHTSLGPVCIQKYKMGSDPLFARLHQCFQNQTLNVKQTRLAFWLTCGMRGSWLRVANTLCSWLNGPAETTAE